MMNAEANLSPGSQAADIKHPWLVGIGLGLVIFLAAGVAGVFDHTHDDAVKTCTDRGIAYFSEIGSSPLLGDGREAAKVARQRCERSTAAFGSSP